MNTFSSEPGGASPDQNISRKERRMERREEAKQSLHRQATRRKMRRVLLWAVSLGALVLAGWGVVRLAQQSAPPGQSGTLSVPVSSDEHIKGNPEGVITLVEYSDFQCPACASFAPVINEVIEQADGQLRVVYRHFPLRRSHPNAQIAGQAAEAASLQGAFWEMHDRLFLGQQEWSGKSSSGAEESFKQYAGELGLDVERFETDMKSDAVKDAVDEDYASGTQSRIQSTPSFFVNGVLISGFRSLDDFRDAVLNASAAQEPAPVEPHNNVM